VPVCPVDCIRPNPCRTAPSSRCILSKGPWRHKAHRR
jgi:hypothetical protein